MTNKILYITIVFFISIIQLPKYEAIKGGREAFTGQFPYQASIQNEFGYHTCNGAIIDELNILTAASCFPYRKGDEHFEQKFKVVVAVSQLQVEQSKKFLKYYEIEIAMVIIPDKFDKEQYIPVADIAVVKLARSLKFLRQYPISKINLPTEENYDTRIAYTSSGFGSFDVWVKDREDDYLIYSDIPNCKNKLYYIKNNIIKEEECKSYIRDEMYEPDMKMHTVICVKLDQSFSNKCGGICDKDIGAPLVYNNTIYGVASVMAHMCNEVKKRSLYTKVSLFLKFIKRAIEYKPQSYVTIPTF